MKEPREDDERLSALLEGRVEGRQREELLAHLAEADDDYEVFTNTASVLRALEEEDARAGRPAAPPSMRRRSWPAARTLVAVAGTMVLLLAVGWLFRGRGGSAAGDPLQLAMRVDMDTAVWSPWTPDGKVRGPGESSSGDPFAVYAGAQLVDLAVMVRTGSPAQIGDLARTLQSRLDGRTDPRAPLGRIAAQPNAPKDTLNAWLELATERHAERLDRKALELGAWIEAARLAALAEDAAFFEEVPSAGMLRRARRMALGDAEAEKAVEAVRAALQDGNAPNWKVRESSLNTMLSMLV